MAKGVEDTAFYRYVRLLALNDVGGDPGRFGISVDGLPRGQRGSARSASRATCSSPRRTTRSARATCARGSARSPRWPTAWAAHVRALARADAPRRSPARRTPVERYLIFQTLVGAWPIERRAAGGLPREGAARGQAQHELGRARRAGEAARPGVRPRAVRARGRSSTDFEPFAAEVARAGERAALGAAAAQAHRARACPTSTRATSCSRSRSSTPTTAGRSTGTRAARAARRASAAAPRRPRDAEAVADRPRARAARAAAGGVRRRLHAAGRRRGDGRVHARRHACSSPAAVRGDGDPVALPRRPLARRAGRRRARGRRALALGEHGIALLERA